MKSAVPTAPVTETPPTTTLWLIRHAEVAVPYHNVFGGRIDMELSPRGHEQAAALAKYLHHLPVNAIYASPMKRVEQTLAPWLVNGGPQPRILAGLREVDFGDWTGSHWNEIQTKFGVSAFAWLDQMECGGIRNGECTQTFRDRVEPCLKQILTDHAGQQVAIACHGGVVRMLLAILLGWPLPQMAAFEIDYASVTQVLWRAPKARLQLVNFAPWRNGHAH